MLAVYCAFVGGAAEGEQGDDVGLGQGGFGAVGEAGLVGAAVEAERDVVIFDAGGGVDVDVGLDTDGVGEVDVAALELVFGAADGGAALGERDAAEQRGRGEGAAQVQIHVAGELGVGVLEVELRAGGEMDVQMQVVGGGVG